MFNTLRYAKMLEEAGFSREQAETSIKVLIEIMEDKLATKQDMVDLKRDISEFKLSSKSDLLQLKHELTLKLGAMLSAAVAIVAALHKFT